MSTEEPLNEVEEEERRRREREQRMEELLRQQEEEELAAAAAAAANEQVVPEADFAIIETPQRGSIGFSYKQISFLSAAALIFYSFRTRQQYYLAIVYMTSSKWAAVILGNALIASTITIFELYVRTFFKNGLRLHEMEGLQDFFRWNVTETCIALTLFRSELKVLTVLEFVLLILLKCCHHVAILRENHLRLTQDAFHEDGWFPVFKGEFIRVCSCLITLQLLDFAVLSRAVDKLITKGASVSILFAFEGAILLVSAWSHLLLWQLHVFDSFLNWGHDRQVTILSRLLHPWKEIKATLQFAVELQSQAVQFMSYLAFFGIVLTYYGMPLNLFREVYVSFTAFRERLIAFWKYRRLLASMNQFDNATAEQLEESGSSVCIICRDDMSPSEAKVLPACQHIFHKSCLREWLVQQQSCPTCRSEIMNEQVMARRAAGQAAVVRSQQQPARQEDQEPTEADSEREQPEIEEERLSASVNEEEPQNADAVVDVVGAERVDSDQAGVESHDTALDRFRESIERQRRGKTAKIGLGSSCSEETNTISNAKREFPAIYKVVRSHGVDVVDESSAYVRRTIEQGMLVLCLERRRMDGKTMLRIPDGLIQGSSVVRVLTLPSSQ